jgi:hypothetical protein
MTAKQLEALYNFNLVCRGRFFTAIVSGKPVCGKDPVFDGVNVTFKDRNKNFKKMSFPAREVTID